MFFIILRVEVAANQLSMLLKLLGKLLGTRTDPAGEKRRPKNVQGKKAAVVDTTGPAAALLYYFRDQLRYD